MINKKKEKIVEKIFTMNFNQQDIANIVVALESFPMNKVKDLVSRIEKRWLDQGGAEQPIPAAVVTTDEAKPEVVSVAHKATKKAKRI